MLMHVLMPSLLNESTGVRLAEDPYAVSCRAETKASLLITCPAMARKMRIRQRLILLSRRRGDPDSALIGKAAAYSTSDTARGYAILAVVADLSLVSFAVLTVIKNIEGTIFRFPQKV